MAAILRAYVVNGEDHWANASDPQIPAALAPVVGGIDSLNNFPRKAMHHLAGVFSRSKATGKVTPLAPLFTFTYPSLTGCFLSPTTCYPLGPYDFATIYNVLPLWNAGIDGTGQTIAIVAKSNINPQDVRDFRNLFGLPAKDPQIIVNGADPKTTNVDDEQEADLDVQWSGAVAKNATIDLVVSASTNSTDGIDLSAAYIVDNNLAPIMSVSFGKCEFFLGTSGNMMFNQLWQQAAMQDITVFVAAGDQGSAMCDTAPFPDVPRERDVCVAGLPCPNATEAAFSVKGLAVNGLASTPYNVAVGGTDFNDFNIWQDFWNVNNNSTTQASAKGYVPETTWNDSCTNGLLSSLGYSADPEANCNNSASQLDFLVVFGGGGGASSCTMSDFNPNTLQGDLSSCSAPYAKPSWQAGNGMPNDGRRDIPDVSLFASNGFTGSFYIVCQADADPDMSGAQCDLNSPFMHFIGIGGTSAASPAFAGIMALVNQKTGSRQGNANYVFYKLAAQSGASCASSGTPGTSCIFYDVTSGTNAMPCLKPSLGCNVSNSADQFGILSGYSATAGYDLATGLGSVNAANLVNNWSTGAVASFSVSPNPANVNIATAGQSGTSTITATGTNGFTGSVSFTCSVSPVPVNDPPTCFVFPFSVSLSATTTSATAALKISTTAGLSSGLQPGNHPKTPIYFAASAGIVMTCVFLLALLGIGVLVFIGLALTSCASERGGSSQINLGTPSGGYIVTVTATSGGAAQSTTVSLNVQ